MSSPVTLPAQQLADMPHKTEVVVLECSGNGDISRYDLMSAAQWSGVPLSDVLALVSPTPDSGSYRRWVDVDEV